MIFWLLLVVSLARHLDTKSLSEAIETYIPDPEIIKMARRGISKVFIISVKFLFEKLRAM